jgi:hypothetical protein
VSNEISARFTLLNLSLKLISRLVLFKNDGLKRSNKEKVVLDTINIKLEVNLLFGKIN